MTTINEMVATLNVTVDGNVVRISDGSTPAWTAARADWDAYLAAHGEVSSETDDECSGEAHAYAALCNAVPALVPGTYRIVRQTGTWHGAPWTEDGCGGVAFATREEAQEAIRALIREDGPLTRVGYGLREVLPSGRWNLIVS